MYSLWRFILKHHFVILFILLEVVSILLLARSQNFHRNRVINTTSDAAGQVYEWSSEVSDYFRLGKTNRHLAEENAWLRQQLSFTNDTTQITYDIQERDTIYEYIPARVVNNSIGQVNNYIIIDKGKVDGIEPDMGVISTDGIVGVVADVSRHYASILSLLHSNSVVGVRFQNSQELGSLKWGNTNYRYGIVEDIPTHVELNEGDTVLTSAYSFIYPEDLMVGTVVETRPASTGALNTAKIRFATDFATLRYVYVIRNMHKPELDSLKANFQ